MTIPRWFNTTTSSLLALWRFFLSVSLLFLSPFFYLFSSAVLLFPMYIFHNPWLSFFPCLPLPKVEQKVEDPPSAIPLTFTYLKLTCLSRVSYVIRPCSHPFISPKFNVILLLAAEIHPSNFLQLHLDLSLIRSDGADQPILTFCLSIDNINSSDR